MYWAVRTVKMYACRAWISNSKPVSTTVITNDAALNINEAPRVNRYQVAIVNTATRMCPANMFPKSRIRSEEHTSELQSRRDLVCRLLLEKKNNGPKVVM